MKGYHVFQTGRLREIFFFFLCEGSQQLCSGAAIVVKIDDRIIGHVPDCFAVVLAPLVDSSRVTNTMGTVTGPRPSMGYQWRH